MYKIIGGDQKEYGPVSFDQLASWVRDNRANGQTVVQKDDGPWVPLGTLPEFAAVLPGATAFPPGAGYAPPAAGSSASIGVGGGVGGGVSGYASGPGPGTDTFRGVGGGRDAAGAVQGPATALLVTGILGAIAVLIGGALAMSGVGATAPAGDLPPELQKVVEMLRQLQSPAMVAIDSIIKLAVAGLIIFASSRLKKLESFPVVVTAAILAMVPCTSPCCCVGLPVGIWVLVAIFKQDVKSSFR